MPENCNVNDCPLTSRVEALERANEQHGNTHREIFRRLGNLENATGEQGVTLKNIDQKLDKLLEWQDDNRERLFRVDTFDRLAEKVERLESKSGKRWDSLVEKALWAVVAAVIAFVLAKVGL